MCRLCCGEDIKTQSTVDPSSGSSVCEQFSETYMSPASGTEPAAMQMTLHQSQIAAFDIRNAAESDLRDIERVELLFLDCVGVLPRTETMLSDTSERLERPARSLNTRPNQ